MTFTFASVDFDEFHAALPGSVDCGTDRFDGLKPISFLLPDGRCVTYRLHDGRVEWNLGSTSEDATVIAIDETSFGSFAAEYLTAPALMIQQRITFESGHFGEFDVWEPLLRLLYTGRPLFDPGAIDPTELDRVFRWGIDSIAEIATFYRRFGFAIVRNVFAANEMEALDREIDRLAEAADATNGDSWWVTGADGGEHVCQLHYTSLSSEIIANLEADPRITELVAAIDRSLVAHPEIGNGHFAVLKNPGVNGGLTDLAWHVDCGLGGHPVLCPSLHIGIQVREMTTESGPMMFLAGSHLSTSVRPTPDQEHTWPVVQVTAQPGDITLHSPDAVHAAPPPTGDVDGRRTLYMAYGRPELSEIFGFKEGYDHLIFPKEGHVEFEA